MSKKEKELMVRMLSTNWALSGLCSYYQDNDEDSMKEIYGVTLKELEKANKHLIELLKK